MSVDLTGLPVDVQNDLETLEVAYTNAQAATADVAAKQAALTTAQAALTTAQTNQTAALAALTAAKAQLQADISADFPDVPKLPVSPPTVPAS